LPSINEFKPPYQPNNNGIREGREKGDLTVFRGERRSQLPMHGGSNELGTGLIDKVKKHLAWWIRSSSCIRRCHCEQSEAISTRLPRRPSGSSQ
jgi:hypothetical protein